MATGLSPNAQTQVVFRFFERRRAEKASRDPSELCEEQQQSEVRQQQRQSEASAPPSSFFGEEVNPWMGFRLNLFARAIGNVVE